MTRILKKNHNQDTIVQVIPLKSCFTSLPASILPSLLLVSSALTHLLADVLLSDRKLLRALAEQSEPSLLSAAILSEIHTSLFFFFPAAMT